MPLDEDLTLISANTQAVYESKGPQFDRERHKVLIERKWLERFRSLLPPSASILDVGCGAGEPIARYFIEHGCAVTGLDYAASMVHIAKQRFPNHEWHVGDMRDLNHGRVYDGIIGWHSFFHLQKDDQRAVLVRFSNHLNTGGALMLTVGPEEGEVTGHVGGEKVYHASLSPQEYKRILHRLGFEIIEFVLEDPECDMSTILLARKNPKQKA